ncbi:S-adenosyl-L-methionine-dependent methyltransferase [Exidia glandulosa HHB12029]|uniref:S-adenosyl-L-methionine-dependent methyltransferase n=1 Tax=Exidia glandulosa HHB12029 TaxID=1314781 RepID=A0A165R1R2_EXIGL|nr:S-adenosyl-L-methionine-dependent methyltransferase [Exidia glandulosa HHB12029]
MRPGLPQIHAARRALATVASASSFPLPPAAPYIVFDRAVKQLQKDRAALANGGDSSRTVDYVRNEIAERMLERLLDVRRKFSSILDVGSGSGHFAKLLEPETTDKVVMLDMSEHSLNRDGDEHFEVPVKRKHADEERLLEVVGRESQEAVVSCLSMHWVNDLPGLLVQIRESLKPDGMLLGALFGGETLFELRTALQLAETEREGGISPHVSPMTDTRDVSNLLGRAGFTLLTVDIDEVQVGYPSMWELLDDLRDMGESNAVIGRRHILHRDTLTAAAAIYQALHGKEDGSIPATFQVIYFIAWKPSPTQPKPLERGTGEKNLQEIL